MTPAELAPIDPAQPAGASAPDPVVGALDPAAAPATGEVPLVPTPHGRHAADDPALVGDEPGPLLASGDSADVYALDDGRVLRRYRRAGHDASAEVALMRHVAAHGFPVPAVETVDGPDVVMERLHGPTLLQALGAEEVSLNDGAVILADLHRRLHAVPAPEGAAPGDVVVHLDLHPGNVILSETHGPALVDWANVRTGAPALDAAMPALLLAEVAVDAGGVYSQGARALLAAFLSASDDDPTSALDAGADVRVHDPALVEGEAELVPQAAALVRDLVAVARPL